jgi:hypothetical protein
MAIKKSIGRTLAQIDVVANTSVRIHEDFFNSHRDYHYLSRFEIGGDKRIYRHLIGCSWQTIALFFRVFLRLFVFRASYTAIG